MHQLKPPQIALSVVELHDARLFLHDCIIRLLQSGLNQAAAAILQSTASWHDETTILITCQTPEQAKPLRQCWQFFSLRAYEEGLKAVKISWKGCEIPYQFTAEMALEEPEIPSLRSDKPELAALQIAETMMESAYPMGLIDLELDDQVWCNQALATIKGGSLDQLRRENVRRLWRTDDLNYVKNTLKQQSQLIWRYRADLNPGDTRQFHSQFELVIDDRYRLTTLYEWEPILVSA